MKGWIYGARLMSLVLCIATAGAQARAQSDAAAVNGESLPLSEFYERLQRVNVRDFILSTTPLTVRTQNAGQVLMDQMINERLTLQWASKANLLPPDSDVQSEVSRLKTQPSVAQALASHQLNEEFLKQGIRYQRARYNLAVQGVTVSSQEVEKYYKDHLAAYTVPERYTLEGLNTSNQADLAKIQADIKAAKPFAEIVKAYSQDPNLKARNGAMGTFNATDTSMPAPIREAVAALKEGQTSGPIKVEADPGGGKPKITLWWFVRMAHREPPSTPPFPAIKAQVEQAAQLEKAGGIQVADKKIADFRQLSEIKINLPGYDMLLPKAKAP